VNGAFVFLGSRLRSGQTASVNRQQKKKGCHLDIEKVGMGGIGKLTNPVG